MHELDITAPMPEPHQGSAEASEESGHIFEQPKSSPAIAQSSTSLEPLAGKSFGNAPGAAEITSRPFGPKRMREAGVSSGLYD